MLNKINDFFKNDLCIYIRIDKAFIVVLLLYCFGCNINNDNLKSIRQSMPYSNIEFTELANNLLGSGVKPNKLFIFDREFKNLDSGRCFTRFSVSIKDCIISFNGSCVDNHAILTVNGNSIKYLLDEMNNNVPVENFIDFSVSDSLMLYDSIGSKEKLVLLYGHSPMASGRYSYISTGILLHIIDNSCYGYYLSSYKNIPEMFFWRYVYEVRNLVYLKVDLENVMFRDSLTTYTISPININLRKHLFIPQRNDFGVVKTATATSPNFFDNTKVKLMSKNW